MLRASCNWASTEYSEYVGSGWAIAPPAGTNVRVAIVRMSSLPLPQRIMSGVTPCSLAAATRNASPVGFGYRRRLSASTSRTAAITLGLGGNGFSFVFSLTTRSDAPGCSPGVYPSIPRTVPRTKSRAMGGV